MFAIIALIALIALLLLLIFRPWASADRQSDVQPTQVTAVTSTPESAQAPQADAAAVTQAAPSEEALATLRSAYDQLGGFDAELAQTATVFNETYLSDDAELRNYNAAAAADLLGRIQAVKSSVDTLDVSGSESAAFAREQISAMLDCLVQRASVISQAWNLSAGAEDPGAVATQIGEVLGRDNDSNGVNVYKTRFNDLYASFNIDAALAAV